MISNVSAKGKREAKPKQVAVEPVVEPEAQPDAPPQESIIDNLNAIDSIIAEVEGETAASAPVATEAPLSSLGADKLKALCDSLNDQIIALHGEGKHEEGDALRVKRMNALAELKLASNPSGHALHK